MCCILGLLSRGTQHRIGSVCAHLRRKESWRISEGSAPAPKEHTLQAGEQWDLSPVCPDAFVEFTRDYAWFPRLRLLPSHHAMCTGCNSSDGAFSCAGPHAPYAPGTRCINTESPHAPAAASAAKASGPSARRGRRQDSSPCTSMTAPHLWGLLRMPGCKKWLLNPPAQRPQRSCGCEPGDYHPARELRGRRKERGGVQRLIVLD